MFTVPARGPAEPGKAVFRAEQCFGFEPGRPLLTSRTSRLSQAIRRNLHIRVSAERERVIDRGAQHQWSIANSFGLRPCASKDPACRVDAFLLQVCDSALASDDRYEQPYPMRFRQRERLIENDDSIRRFTSTEHQAATAIGGGDAIERPIAFVGDRARVKRPPPAFWQGRMRSLGMPARSRSVQASRAWSRTGPTDRHWLSWFTEIVRTQQLRALVFRKHPNQTSSDHALGGMETLRQR
jgi:hypothetical protein